MDIEALVATITRAVLQEIEGGSAEPKILVFARKEEELPERLCRFLAGKAWALYSGGEPENANIERFILPHLYIDQMVDLALGKGGSRLMYGVRATLLRGCRVEVCELEHRAFCKSAPAGLYSLYESYWRTLRGFGLVEFRESAGSSEPARRRLITEKDIVALHASGTGRLEVESGCRVTPLAKERAGQLGVEIVKQTGGKG
jgi:hypothetical protein